MNILLLNPPGTRAYSRDYFCCKVTKGSFIEHPVDFLFLAGRLLPEHSVSILNAILDTLSPQATRDRLRTLQPDAVIFLTGTASYQEDFPFLQSVRTLLPQALLIGIGDIFFQPEIFADASWMDAVLFDFTTPDLLHFLRRDLHLVRNMCFRQGPVVIERLPERQTGEFSVPRPRHDLFVKAPYTFPFARFHPYATILTDFGCPFSCRFCLYGTLGHKRRPVAEVLDELRFCRSLGIRELFFKDQAFGAIPERTRELCDGMRRLGRFSWSCFMRADSITRDILPTLKQAGCHTVMIGVESANDGILGEFHKGVQSDRIREAFALCREAGIQTLGIFILGFPGETDDSCQATIQFAVTLDCDFASFNIFVPKLHTPARQDLIHRGVIPDRLDSTQDQSGCAALRSLGRLSDQRLRELHEQALRRFYFRPRYLWNRLRDLRTRHQLRSLLASGWKLFSTHVLSIRD